jgi:hypothetical protein
MTAAGPDASSSTMRPKEQLRGGESGSKTSSELPIPITVHANGSLAGQAASGHKSLMVAGL